MILGSARSSVNVGGVRGGVEVTGGHISASGGDTAYPRMSSKISCSSSEWSGAASVCRPTETETVGRVVVWTA